MPGFSAYGLQQVEGQSISLIKILFPLILLFPILIYRFLAKRIIPDEYNFQFIIEISIYILFALIIIFLEINLPNMYSIGRSKSFSFVSYNFAYFEEPFKI